MFEQLDARYQALSLREKYLVLITGIVLIVFAGFTFIVEPQYIKNQQVESQIKTTQIELSSAQQQIALLQEALADDPNEKLQTRIDNLHARIAQMDSAFASQMRELVQPQQMPMVIEQMLAFADKLKLVELSSIPPISVFEGDSENADLPLYQHGVRFQFEGQYVDVLEYLEGAEAMPWQVYWHSLDYQVGDYPNASVTLELFTLSTSRAFIGVQ
ncbi:type II secretion system protein GspM [Alteromonas facilis]|uniref:type II secretion system protein GspM n=1 Tax=Alteromonas facilis TaxID=2048004 RepID=UPI000C29306D|nr:type II secretion system protein GspM [Alteromonas facilis]